MLAGDLRKYAGRDDVLVLALPRGGVPVGFEVAKELDAPLDVIVARKIGAPGREEYGVGAIASGTPPVIDEASVRAVGATAEQVNEVVERERTELHRRERTYRGDRPFPDVRGRTVLLVDDGIATGVTTRAAVTALKSMEPHELVVAVPVAPADSIEAIAPYVDDVVVVQTPDPFYAVGLWYDAFDQTTDDEVIELLRRGAGFGAGARARESEREVSR